MVSRYIRRIALLAVPAVFCLATAELMAQQTVTYAASGTTPCPSLSGVECATFSTPQARGADRLSLAGQPFTVRLTVSTTAKPAKHGPKWALYEGLTMSGTFYSSISPGAPISCPSAFCQSSPAYLFLTTANSPYTGNGKYQLLLFGFHATIDLGYTVMFHGRVELPLGTISGPTIQPFAAPVSMSPTTAGLTYSCTTGPGCPASTSVTIASGTVTTTIGSDAPTAQVHGVGTQAHFPGLDSLAWTGDVIEDPTRFSPAWAARP